ncbi:hypothetical protein L6452_20413 [Arctium lappa]|uniref:Uncharacterized protein n=1 Tax=Arctium lappa TaxID=4217 RepID=A0ACB9BC43_ARCLA|nr:hypothetical protein L6452_20413 [Arctium lappa]
MRILQNPQGLQNKVNESTPFRPELLLVFNVFSFPLFPLELFSKFTKLLDFSFYYVSVDRFRFMGFLSFYP